MKNLGYKKITKKNWLKPDRISTSFVLLPLEKQDVNIKKGEFYLEMFLHPHLNESVPLEVRKLFEVARGALVYGYFFYPLYSLACEQLFRVGEAAITFRCKRIDPRKGKRTFEKNINFLFDNGILNEQERQRWHELRKLRNSASHPEDQSIYPPGPVILMLTLMVRDLNALFTLK